MNHQFLVNLVYASLALLFAGATAVAAYLWREARRREKILMGIVIALNELIGLKDGATEGHCVRVKRWAHDIGTALGLGRRELDETVLAAMLHDIGKIGVPDAILLKPDRLTGDEYTVIKTHPDLGAGVLQSIDLFAPMARILRHHHERYDGAGYPDGLKGGAIPMGARIVAVLDAYDAMISNRAYRPAMPVEKAMSLLREGRGTQFDPLITDIFCSLLESGVSSSADPVCGMAGKGGYSIIHNGRRYYFCSMKCREEFEKKPEKYA